MIKAILLSLSNKCYIELRGYRRYFGLFLRIDDVFSKGVVSRIKCRVNTRVIDTCARRQGNIEKL